MKRFELLSVSPKKGLYFKAGDKWTVKTSSGIKDDTIKVAKGLYKLGYKNGKVIFTVLNNSYDFLIIDFASCLVGAVLSSAFINDEDISEQIEKVKPDVLIVAHSNETVTASGGVAAGAADGAVGAADGASGADKATYFTNENCMEYFVEQGKDVSDEELFDNFKAKSSYDTSIILNTTGTTGAKKGVRISDDALISSAKTIYNAFSKYIDDPKTKIGFLLPLTHIFNRSILYAAFFGNCKNTLIDLTSENFFDDLNSSDCSIIPYFSETFESTYNTLLNQKMHFPKGKLKDFALKMLPEIYQSNKLHNKALRLILNPLRSFVDKKFYSQIRKFYGQKLEFFIAGGAKLDPKVQNFYNFIGLRIYEGYGSTELIGPISCNLPGNNKNKTVGKPFQGIDAKISPNGELLISKEHIFDGYVEENAVQTNRGVIGYFATGDLATIDEDGYITILGRLKK
jgi:long-chain acyl-CoA synthetase